MSAVRDCERKSVRVFVDGVEIPTVDSSEMRDDEEAVETQIRTDGPADITYLSDVYFPAEWRGVNVFDLLPLDKSGRMSVPVEIRARPPVNANVARNWQTIHRGWLHKIGSGGDGRLLRMRVGDYATIANNTPVTKTYKNTNAESVIRDSIKRLRLKSNIPDVVLNELPDEPLAQDQTEEELAADFDFSVFPDWSKRAKAFADDLGDIAGGVADFFIGGGGNKQKENTFNATNGDTVADVLNWVTDKTNTVWFFSPVDRTTVSLIVMDKSGLGELFTSQQVAADRELADDAPGPVFIHKNQALYNIDPVNKVVVVGEQVEIDYETDGQTYVVGTATHTDLLENADGQVNSKLIRGSFSNAENAARKARKEMKKEHSHNNEGQIVLDGRPDVSLYSKVEAIPVCNDLIDGDMNSTTYEVKEVEHALPATDRYTTTVNVGIASTDDEIETTAGYGDGKGDIIYTLDDIFLQGGTPDTVETPSGETIRPVTGD